MFQHQPGADPLLLRRLEEETDRAAELLLGFLQDPGRQQHRSSMEVMAAGMTDPFPLRSELQARILLDGQGVDVRPDRRDPVRAGLFAPDLSDQSGLQPCLPHLDPIGLQLPADQGGGVYFLHAQLWMAVQLPAQGDRVSLISIDQRFDIHKIIPFLSNRAVRWTALG